MTDAEALCIYECSRKERRFDTFTEADEHAWYVEQRPDRKTWHGLYAYGCHWCDGFHIGRTPAFRLDRPITALKDWGRKRRVEHARYYVLKHPEWSGA